MASSTVENYLKHLLLLSPEGGGLIAMGALASALAVVPGTATTMVKSLAAEGWVDHRPRRGVRLTETGRRLALNVLRRHRLIETFLVNILKMDWSSVHEEAEQLEHAISEDVLNRLDVFLGHPTTDPHGDPIPSRQGKLRRQEHFSLGTCPLGPPLAIVRITEQTPEFLHFAEAQGLFPGTALRVEKRDLQAGTVVLKKKNGKRIPLSLNAAEKIWVKLEERGKK